MADINDFSTTAYSETPSNVTLTPSVNIGQRRMWKGESYVYCYNAGGATASVGNGVKAITGNVGYSMAATSISDTVNPCIGVIKHNDVPTLAYGWVLTKGYASVVVNTTVANPNGYYALALGANGGFVQGGTGGTGTVCGYAFGPSAVTGGLVSAFISTIF